MKHAISLEDFGTECKLTVESVVKTKPVRADEWNMFISIAGWTSALISVSLLGAPARAQVASDPVFLTSDSPAPVVSSARYEARPKRARVAERRMQSEGPAVPVVVAKPAEPTPTPTPTPSPTPAKTLSAANREPILEMSVAPGFVYSNSDSDYSFRRYTSAAPTVGAAARVWFDPEFAISGSYDTSLSGNVSDSLTSARNVQAIQEWLSIGIRTRKRFGSASLPSWMVFGADYYESNFKVPSNAQMRESFSTKGLKLSLDAELAASPTYAWTFAFWFAPKLFHREEKAAANFESGGSTDTNSLGASIGGKISFESTDAMFWKIGYSIEKNQFGGSASTADPETGVRPSGVSVLNGTALLQFGYSWSR